MRKSKAVGIVTVLLLALAVVAASPSPINPEPAASEDGVSVYFSPKGGCEDAVVAQMRAAKRSIDVQAYSFTNTAIAKALVDAKKRGVRVRVVLDKSNASDKYSAATFLLNNGVKPYIDGEHAIAHNKIIIVDGQTVITGSFNFSKAAENSNAENLVIITGRAKIADAYSKNFSEHLAHSSMYVRPKE